MYISEEDFKELVVSSEVKNFVSLIETYPDRFDFSHGPNFSMSVTDLMTGVSGCACYRVHLYGEVEAYGLCDLNHINAAEAKIIFEAVIAAREKKLEEDKRTAKEKFQNAYQSV